MSTDRTAHGPLDVATVERAMAKHVGPEQAATWKEIAAELGLRDDRKLRQIACGRMDGEAFLICQNEHGVFLAQTPEQAAEYQAKEDARILALLKRRSRRKRLARAMFVRPVEQASMGLAS